MSENKLFVIVIVIVNTDDPSLSGSRATIKVLGYQCPWVAGGYGLEIGRFYKWLAFWLPGG